MAQKSKAAAQQPRTSKPIAKTGKTSTVKTPVASKPAKAVAGKAAKVTVKTAAPAVKAAAPAKAVKGKPVPPTKPGPAPTVAKNAQSKPAAAMKVAPTKPAVPPAKTVEAKPEKQIEQAKAALKKQSAEAVTPAKTKAESKARARKISIEASANEAASALAAKWTTLYKKAEQIEAKPYNMKAVFEEKTAITHKVLGWGYILTNTNDRLEVLFKDGIKYLISNYKP